MMFKAGVLASAIVALAGCAFPGGAPDPDSAFYAVPVGSVVELHQAVTVPAGRTRVWLQRGRVVPGQDRYHPGCSLEVRTLDRERAQTVAPGRFTVWRVQQVTEYVQSPDWPLQFAGPAFLTASVDGDDGGPDVRLGYHLWLENTAQPDVMRFTCLGAQAQGWRVVPPSIADIREAFGSVATLQVP